MWLKYGAVVADKQFYLGFAITLFITDGIAADIVKETAQK